MEKRQKQVIEAYQRVQEFVRTHPVQPPASYAGGGQLLDEAVERLTGHTTMQAAGRRTGGAETVRQKTLARELRELHLRPISKIARAVLRAAPGIDVALRIPRQTLAITTLIAEARAVSSAVTAYSPVFVANGRPKDFLEQLDTAIELLRRSTAGRARKLGTKVAARAGIAKEIRRGRDAVEMIDAVVTTSFANQEEVLAEWRSARRVHAVPGNTTKAPAAGTASEVQHDKAA